MIEVWIAPLVVGLVTGLVATVFGGLVATIVGGLIVNSVWAHNQSDREAFNQIVEHGIGAILNILFWGGIVMFALVVLSISLGTSGSLVHDDGNLDLEKAAGIIMPVIIFPAFFSFLWFRVVQAVERWLVNIYVNQETEKAEE